MNVIDKTACAWEKVAIRLHFEGHDISRIRRNERQAEDACRTMFTEWLEGKGRTPTTWGTVLQALNEARQGELANDLEEVLDTLLQQNEIDYYAPHCELFILLCCI